MSELSESGPSESRIVTVHQQLRDALVTGVALTIPLVVTLMVLGFVVNFLANAVQPLVDVLRTVLGIGSETPDAVIQVVTLSSMVVTVLVIGFVAEYRSGDRIDRAFDGMMERIPGLGSVYTSFNEMTEMLMNNDAHTFQEVYLVEYPTDDSYALAFETADTPDFVEDVTGHDEMVTLFMPMAPNPVMGGYVIHVAADRLYDVEMTVQEGLQSIVTSGVATGGETHPGLSPSDLAAIGATGRGSEPVTHQVDHTTVTIDESREADGRGVKREVE